MSTYAVAFLIGVAAGFRSMIAPAAVSWAARLGWLHLENTGLAFLGYAATPYVFSVLAIEELIARKISFSFGPRIVSGALCGAALGASSASLSGGLSGGLAGGLLVGAAGAVAGALGSSGARALKTDRLSVMWEHATMLRSRKLALTTLLVLASLMVYGFFHQRLFAQQMWTPEGGRKFLLYTAVFWTAAGALLLAAPRWLGAIAAGFVLSYTAWWSGPAALLAVLYFMGACFLTGRILARRADAATALLLGLAVWMFLVWMALHFRVNTRAAYAAAMAVPYIWEARRWRGHIRGFRVLCASRSEAAGLALLLFLLMAHWLVALRPEVSADGVSMHLALPMAVAHDRQWTFDIDRYTWALMPAGGDSVFTAAYLLGGSHGGEAAARLTNFALLALMAAMVAQASRQWLGLSAGRAFLVAALFASTPLVQLVTGSLFVENVWAALILGASFELVRYWEKNRAADLSIAGALFGAALAVKLIAALFLAPAALIAVWIAVRRKDLRPLLTAAVCLALLAVPAYLFAYIKSGNPVFPFANTIFRSPYFDAREPFIDGRFMAPLSWRTPYDAVFRSGMFFEGQGGGAGFQYLLFLIPAILLPSKMLAHRRAVWLLLVIGGASSLMVLGVLHNLRYLYPALPLFSIALGALFAEGHLMVVAGLALTAVNVWFLPSAGWYDSDFALFRRAEVAQSIEASAPERNLVEYLNQSAPGQPVAFFASDGIAGLHARAYANTWHTYGYSRLLSSARSAADVAAILRQRDIRHIIAPRSLETTVPLLDTFLREWAEPENVASGAMALFRLRDAPVVIPRELVPFPPGAFDDLDNRIEYTGAWIHDNQFVQPLSGSVTYCDVPGGSLRFAFTGTGITYIFTKARNRGIAEVWIDGEERAQMDLYSRATVWRSERSFDGLGPGKHTFELRVLGKKTPAARGAYVDLDGIIIR